MFPVTEHRGDADPEPANFDHPETRGDVGVEPEEPHVGTKKRGRLIADGGDRSNKLFRRKTEVGRPEADAAVMHLPHAVSDGLILDLGLSAEAFHQSTKVDCDHWPASCFHGLQKVLPAAEAALLIFLPGAAARLDIAIEFPSDCQDCAGGGPVGEQATVPGAKLSFDLIAHPCPAVGSGRQHAGR